MRHETKPYVVTPDNMCNPKGHTWHYPKEQIWVAQPTRASCTNCSLTLTRKPGGDWHTDNIVIIEWP